MKFRATMSDGFCMRRFAVTLTTLSKLGKQCIVCLSKDDLCFVIFEEGVPKRPLAWCTLQQNQFFDVFNIAGVSPAHNNICLQFSPDMFARAISPLKMPTSVKSFKIKLTQKNTPCLTCEMELTTVQYHSRLCMHDIPVVVIPIARWSDLAMPKELQYDLVIQMPNMKRFKSVCDRMRTLANQAAIEANNDGVFALKIERDLATITTYFKELSVKTDDRHAGMASDEFFSVKVDFKKLISFLGIDALNPGKIACKIIDQKLLFMHLVHENVTLHYLIPGIAT